MEENTLVKDMLIDLSEKIKELSDFLAIGKPNEKTDKLLDDISLLTKDIKKLATKEE